MDLRSATIQDLDEVLECWIALLEEQTDYGSLLDPGRNRTAGRKLLADAIVEGRVIVAEEDGTIRGVTTVSVDDGTLALRASHGIVETLYVAPEFRGEGIGTRLLRAAEQRLREEGCSTVTVEVMAENDDSRSFYSGRGYEPHRVVLRREVESDTKPPDET